MTIVNPEAIPIVRARYHAKHCVCRGDVENCPAIRRHEERIRRQASEGVESGAESNGAVSAAPHDSEPDSRRHRKVGSK